LSDGQQTVASFYKIESDSIQKASSPGENLVDQNSDAEMPYPGTKKIPHPGVPGTH